MDFDKVDKSPINIESFMVQVFDFVALDSPKPLF